ncbi:AMP-dependent synthetase and ligase [Candidatus Sulfotelmatobacter sp. SbA7]|jgi:acyl-CoA synthetase (AMP-forming)/AMP-acid ligase II|nr:AMP-dependent synthetase and ligase [Candidatus Sulfotelmatobacter sp. SbA7]
MTLKSVHTLLDVLHFADSHTAVIAPEHGISVTYDSLRQQVLAMADALASAGIRRGDRVAMVLPNGLPAIVSFLAASIAGTAAPLNPAYPYEEFLFFLGDTDARVLLCPPVGAEFARNAALDRKIPVLPVEMSPQGNVHLVDAPTGASATEPTADDIALVLHTSGSTGRPKRVPLRHFNLAVSSANIANTYALSEDDVSLCVMPLFHIHGLIGSTMATLLSGGTLVVPSKFNALSFWRTVREHHVTWYSGVPTMHQLLLARTHHKPAEAASLRFIRSCSAPLSAELIHKIESLFGVPFVEAYGMTEAAHQMTSNPLPPRHRKAGSVGVGTGIRMSVMDREGNHLGTGQRGEVVIQGASVFRGYENNPEANAKAFVNGWFRTGDEGLLDADCYLHLTGRIKDIIIRGGENIAPHEVDEALLRHPAVAAAVTFGCAHPILGEEVAAAVVLHEPHGATEVALLKHCREILAEYKCPKKIYLVKSIPTTATGKIRRRAVAAALLDDQR